MKKKIHEDQRIIEGLKTNNRVVIASIYDRFAPKVIHYIKNNNGDIDQAKDVIQEVLMAIYHQAQKKNLKLTCPFEAYFLLLCKRRWWNILKSKGQPMVTIEEHLVSVVEEASQPWSSTEDEQYRLYEEKFQKLGSSCQELLQLSFKINSMETVAKKMNVTYAYARKKKSLCIKQLTELIRGASNFSNLIP